MRILIVAILILTTQVCMAGMWCHKGTGNLCEYGAGHRLPDGAHYWTDTECVNVKWKTLGTVRDTDQRSSTFTGVCEELARKILAQQKEIDEMKKQIHLLQCPICEESFHREEIRRKKMEGKK